MKFFYRTWVAIEKYNEENLETWGILGSLSKEIVMYLVIWWDASGDCRASERMSYVKACAFRDSMNAEQEAGLMYVNE